MSNTEAEFALGKIIADAGRMPAVQPMSKRGKTKLKELAYSVTRELANCEEIDEIELEIRQNLDLGDTLDHAKQYVLFRGRILGTAMALLADVEELAWLLDCQDRLDEGVENYRLALESLVSERLGRLSSEGFRESIELCICKIPFDGIDKLIVSEGSNEGIRTVLFRLKFATRVLQPILLFDSALESVMLAREARSCTTDEFRKIAPFIQMDMQVAILPRIASLLSLSELRVGDRVFCGGLSEVTAEDSAPVNGRIFGTMNKEPPSAKRISFQVVSEKQNILELVIRRLN